MESTWHFLLFMLVLAAIALLLLAPGLYLIVRDTARRQGRWGINSRRMACPRCATKAPPFRIPSSLTELLWGGFTCRHCGCKVDKWGVERT